MNVRHKFQQDKTIKELFENHFDKGMYADEQLLFLVDLIHVFRPKKPNQVEQVFLTEFIDFLECNPNYITLFRDYFKTVISKNKFSRLLTDSGILNDNHFFKEIKKRLFEKFLPFQPEKGTLQFVLNQVFYLSTDPIWINKIPYEQIIVVYQLLGFTDIYENIKQETPFSEVVIAMQVLAQRMSGRALENDVIKMVPEYSNFESPFLGFEKELSQLEVIVRANNCHYIPSTELVYKQVLLLHKQCNDFVDKAFLNSSKFGISLSVNQNLLRIRQQLVRIRELLPLLVVENEEGKKRNSTLVLLKLIRYNCYKNNIRKLFLESTQLISYEITQHTAKSGQKYITDGYKEYFSMFYKAIGGGFIVGFLCLFKLLFSRIETSAFGHAFFYSLNYASGFILIFLLGFTLATKQPAMTAATIAQALDEGMKKKNQAKDKHTLFAKLFARIFRTQFIAFVGNVLFAFPVSLFLIWILDVVLGVNYAEARAGKLINDLNPIHSFAIFHAAIAGVYLFFSGIISGNIANRNKHYQVAYRIQENPFLKQTFGIQKTKKISNWVDANWAGVISNMWFGVFLGSTASVGMFFGITLDIRHITFASGNFALGLYGNHFLVNFWSLFWSLVGIGLIGFINFIVSFSLSMFLALRSRNIPFSELRLLNTSIFYYFKRAPLNFFFPLKDKV
ncbi:site-specific recombinase [Flavobacterium sp. 7A]|uniref:site-specific recombinase n=1 Tax=Flavobacterium sp. 7A TaxID=2940571 RepID=UPI0022272395|nr:site-specific recombinase [Flavobacterium sp. 7A]MCW2120970.1 site-specific recombinase [Flavobacterium sp. 7A]